MVRSSASVKCQHEASPIFCAITVKDYNCSHAHQSPIDSATTKRTCAVV